jgi:hypothetical protein
MGQSRGIDVAEQGPASDFRNPCPGIDQHLLHQRQIEHDAAVASGKAGKAVPAAADGQQGVPFGGNADNRLHVALAGGAHDPGRPPVDQAVVDAAQAVVERVAAGDQGSVELCVCKVSGQCAAIHPKPPIRMPASLSEAILNESIMNAG